MRNSNKILIGLSLLLASACAPKISDQALQTRAKTDLNMFKHGLEMYVADKGQYPTESEGLSALEGLYIQKLPIDPWGRNYIYRLPGPDGKPFDILSYGEDAKPGGDEADKDLSVWD